MDSSERSGLAGGKKDMKLDVLGGVEEAEA
jgi:hypothetical protein